MRLGVQQPESVGPGRRISRCAGPGEDRFTFGPLEFEVALLAAG